MDEMTTSHQASRTSKKMVKARVTAARIREIPDDTELVKMQQQAMFETKWLSEYCRRKRITKLSKHLKGSAACIMVGGLTVITKPGRCGEWKGFPMKHMCMRILDGVGTEKKEQEEIATKK